MLTSIATGVLALCALLVAWVTVQVAWRRAFPGSGDDPDALAGRLSCHGLCPPDECARRHALGCDAREEDDR